MKSVKFQEVNLNIGENQEEYENLYAYAAINTEYGLMQVTVCFELSKAELEQIAKTGKLWFSVLKPPATPFNPIMLSTEKPELCVVK